MHDEKRSSEDVTERNGSQEIRAHMHGSKTKKWRQIMSELLEKILSPEKT